jgi:hypothetical protein
VQAPAVTDADGAGNLHAGGPAHLGAPITAALDALTDQRFRHAHADGRREPRAADAFNALVALAGRGGPTPTTPPSPNSTGSAATTTTSKPTTARPRPPAPAPASRSHPTTPTTPTSPTAPPSPDRTHHERAIDGRRQWRRPVRGVSVGVVSATVCTVS